MNNIIIKFILSCSCINFNKKCSSLLKVVFFFVFFFFVCFLCLYQFFNSCIKIT